MFTDLWAGKPDFADGNGNNRKVNPINQHGLYYQGALTLAASGVAMLAALAF